MQLCSPPVRGLSTAALCLIFALVLPAHSIGGPCCTSLLPTAQFQLNTVVFPQGLGASGSLCQNFNLAFAVPGSFLQVGASKLPHAAIADFGTYSFASEVDIHVNAKLLANNTVSVILFSDQRWSNIKVSLLSTARLDVFIGTFAIDTSDTFDTTLPSITQTTIKANTYVPRWSPAANFSFLGLFLSGIRACSLASSMCLSVSIDPMLGYIEGTATLNSNAKVQYIEVTYLLSNSSELLFSYVSGPSTAGLVNWPVSTCILSGVPKISTLTVQYQHLSCLGLQCPTPFINQNACQSLNGTVSGCLCVVCESSMIFSNGQCVCPASMYLSPNLTCQFCWPNSTLAADTLNCICISGTYLVGPTFCGPPELCLNANANPATGLCECVNPAVFVFNSGCVCPDIAFEYDSVAQNCRCNATNYLVNGKCTACWPNSQASLDRLTCVCSDGYLPGGPNLCVPLPPQDCGTKAVWKINKCVCSIPGATFNPATKDCPCLPPTKYDATVPICRCPASFYLYNDQSCAPCWPNSQPSNDGKTCVCLPGYLPAVKQCRPKFNCPPPSLYNPITQTCECGSNQQFLNNTCVCNNPQQTFNPVTRLCVCAPGFYPEKGVCTLCWNNSVSSFNGTTCVCQSGFLLVADKTCSSSFASPPLLVWDPNQMQLVCGLPNMVLAQGGCVCINGYVFASGSCVCSPLSVLAPDGTCYPCPANSAANSARNACVCLAGFFFNQRTCNPIPVCPPGSVFDANFLGCRCLMPGLVFTADKGCSCPPSLVYDFQQQVCLCPNNSYFLNGACSSCWANSISRGCLTTCDCAPGYYLAGPQQCMPIPTCPNNSRFDFGLQTCVCIIPGQLLQGNSCVCSGGSTLGIDGTFCQCASGVIDAVTGQCSANVVCSSTYLSLDAARGCLCNDPNSFFDPLRKVCACMAGFDIQNAICVPVTGCLAPAVQKGCSCVCPDPVMVYVDGCRCPLNMVFNPSGKGCICDVFSVPLPSGLGCLRCVQGESVLIVNGQKQCVQTQCDAYSLFNASLGGCVCQPSAYPLTNSSCICPLGNSAPNQLNYCRCQPGYYYLDSSLTSCRPCWANSSPSPDLLTCICNANFTQVGSKCIGLLACRPNEVFTPLLQACVCSSPFMVQSSGGCACPPTMLQTNSCCVCPNSTYFSAGKCLSCPSNTFFNGFRCVCLPNFVAQPDGSCAVQSCTPPAFATALGCACPATFAYDLASAKCQCIGNRVQLNGTCVCPANTFLQSNLCYPCPPNSVSTANQLNCVCNPGSFLQQTTLNGSPVLQCVNQASCGPNQVLNTGTNTCQCTVANMIQVVGGCVCGTGMVLDPSGKICVCQANYVPVTTSTCQACPPNSQPTNGVCQCNPGFMASGTLCVPASTCPPDASFNQNLQSCVCLDPNKFFNSLQFQCQCSGNNFALAGQCQPCWANSSPTPNHDNCTCSPNFSFSPPSSCVSNLCSPLQTLSNGICVCLPSLVLVNGNCACPPSATGVNKVFANNLNRCVCPAGTYTTGATCTPCPSNSQSLVQDAAVCTCNAGLTFVNGICLASCPVSSISTQAGCICPPNTVFNLNSICVCDAFSLNTSNTCVRCPPNSYLNGSTCICYSGFITTSSQTCVANPTFCLSGSSYSTLLGSCVCRTSEQTYSPTKGCQCPPSFILDPQLFLCLCPPGQFRNNASCFACAPNSVSLPDSSGCVCSPGFVVSASGGCVADTSCLPGATLVSGKCTCSDSTLVYSPAVGCLCPSPLQVNNPLDPGRCVCNGNAFLSAGVCTLCPLNSRAAFNGTACECLAGFVQSSGGCVAMAPCLPPASSTGNACTCPGPAQTYTPGIGCTCPPNFIAQTSGQCTCDTTVGLLTAGCAACPAFSKPDATGSSCLCVVGAYNGPAGCTPIPLCPLGTFFDLDARKCLCFQSSGPNSGCNCINIFALVPPSSSCSCLLRASPPPAYFQASCSANAQLSNTGALQLTLADLLTNNNTVSLKLCGSGTFAAVAVTRVAANGLFLVNPVPSPLGQALSFVGCFMLVTPSLPSSSVVLAVTNDNTLLGSVLSSTGTLTVIPVNPVSLGTSQFSLIKVN